MVAFKTFGFALLPIAAAAAKCYRGCSPDNDQLLALLSTEPEAVPFCSEFLGIGTSTVPFTVTPTVVVSETVTTTDTTITTEIESSTTTVSAPLSTITIFEARKREVAYPEWLPESYKDGHVSYACKCLSRLLSTPVVTSTETAEAVTVTEPSTTTDTVTSTYHSTVTVTETAEPAPPPPQPVVKRAKIQAFRKTTGDAVGWLYMSNGPAITSDPALASIHTFSITAGAQSASQVRFAVEGFSPFCLAFNVPASQSLGNYYGAAIANSPTPPGSPPVISGSAKYETDIFTIDTTTKVIGYNWIESNGAIPSPIYLYRVGGRMYPVGNLAVFNSAFGSVSSASKYEIYLKYVEV